MAASFKLRGGAMALILAVAQAAAAYEHPLDSHSIREAYFLGNRKDEKAAKFIGQYVKRLPLPKTGPHVAEIEVSTPFQQVVLRAFRAPGSYSAQQAQRDYLGRPDLVFVRVRIYLTPTYPAYIGRGKEGVQERPPDFWRDFPIKVTQGKAITPKTLSGQPVYQSAFRAAPPLAGALQGAEVQLEFETAQIASESLRVEVLTPDGQTIEAEFDLKDLR